jgi:hypothetical protein
MVYAVDETKLLHAQTEESVSVHLGYSVHVLFCLINQAFHFPEESGGLNGTMCAV